MLFPFVPCFADKVSTGVAARAGLGSGLNTPFRPLGTLLANISGTLLLAVLIVVAKSHPHDALDGCQIGFAGSLTTVSSFIKEVCSGG